MSYLVGNFYQNPPPPYGALVNPSNESLDTVPGWGVIAAASGPALLSVGLDAPLTAGPTPADVPACPPGQVWSAAYGQCVRVVDVSFYGQQPFAFPWWGWIVGAGVIGAGFAVAVKKGWIG